jgi:hypothetical protein
VDSAKFICEIVHKSLAQSGGDGVCPYSRLVSRVYISLKFANLSETRLVKRSILSNTDLDRAELIDAKLATSCRSIRCQPVWCRRSALSADARRQVPRRRYHAQWEERRRLAQRQSGLWGVETETRGFPKIRSNIAEDRSGEVPRIAYHLCRSCS